MTRKDFELIAAALLVTQPSPRSHKEDCYRWNYVVREMVRQLQGSNSRFDSDRFIAACGGYVTPE